jgi:hypothetical protein
LNNIFRTFQSFIVCCTNGANNPTCNLDPPCGTLLNFYQNDITQLGFASGTYYDGSTIYPGTGAFDMCAAQNPAPARIVNNFVGSRIAGAYTSCALAPEYYEDKAPKFFMKHPKLKWVSTAYPVASLVPGVITVGPVYLMQVGRTTLNIGNGTFYQIGKVYASALYHYKPGDLAESISYGSFEVLVCDP